MIQNFCNSKEQSFCIFKLYFIIVIFLRNFYENLYFLIKKLIRKKTFCIKEKRIEYKIENLFIYYKMYKTKKIYYFAEDLLFINVTNLRHGNN